MKWIKAQLEKEPADILPIILVIIAGLAIGITTIVYINNFDANFSPKNSDWGDFGSYFGGTVSSICTFLAFLVLVMTYTTNRTELKETKNVLNNQNKLIAKQSFETTYLKLLERIYIISSSSPVSDISYDLKGKVVSRICVFIASYKDNDNYESLSTLIRESFERKTINTEDKKKVEYYTLTFDYLLEHLDNNTAKSVHLALFIDSISDEMYFLTLINLLLNSSSEKLIQIEKNNIIQSVSDETYKKNFKIFLNEARDSSQKN